MATSKLPADDLFENSSMSFGEHLEELRKALVKSFIWLGIGTAIGLFFAQDIVQFLETPLQNAISEFYVEQAKRKFKDANGVEPPEELAKWISSRQLMPEQVYIDPSMLANSLEQSDAAPATEAGASEAPANQDDEKSVNEPAQSGSIDSGSNSDPSENESIVADDSEADVETGDENSKPSTEDQSEEDDSKTETAEAGLFTGGSSATEDEANPWKGIAVEQLLRLEPMLIWKPIANNLVSLTATEPFMMWLKAGLVAGVVIGSPGIFWHIWQFFAAGLYPHERRYVYWYLPLSLFLFLAGVSLAFFVVFELVLGFLMTYTEGLNVTFMPRLSDFMTFVLFLPLGFGIAFQLPIVMLGLHRFGVVSVETFIKQWRVAVLAIAFMSMVFTPAEIYSMLGLFIPLVGLYFFGIGLCKWMPQGAGVGSPQVDPQG